MVFAEEVTGISKERLIQFAHEVAKADSVAICWAMGITQQDIEVIQVLLFLIYYSLLVIIENLVLEHIL